MDVLDAAAGPGEPDSPDEPLAFRIRLFRDSGQVRPEVAAFVAAELVALAAEGHTVTEESAGLLTSHLLMALTRLLDGEPIAGSDADGQIAAELSGHPTALARARAVALRAGRELGAVLPESEVNFLGMHLAVLAQRSTHRS
ncbi:transcriptional antiterminator [Streptomyces boluensis]|uniref:Transcriptional antiterminator n=1 Tax=Streptomyces boluensis TaxID=1775135 RepID=A0A964UPU5_9ACTN|nr:transcriptional antiterminator [Streptomyces boluensis]NBE53119.1 transcriptional antiterminator [Streptomyces boluensis]